MRDLVRSFPVVFVGLVILFLFAAASKGHRSPDAGARRAADLKAIDDLHRRDSAAAKACDVETLVSLLSDDVVSLPPAQAPAVGKTAARAMLEAGCGQSSRLETLPYDQTWKDVQVAGDYAFEWGTFRSAVRPKAGDEALHQSFHVLRVLQREAGGDWKVYRTIWNEAPAGAGGE